MMKFNGWMGDELTGELGGAGYIPTMRAGWTKTIRLISTRFLSSAFCWLCCTVVVAE